MWMPLFQFWASLDNGRFLHQTPARTLSVAAEERSPPPESTLGEGKTDEESGLTAALDESREQPVR